MNGLVVVDASLAFKWLVNEENSDKARAISRSWTNEGIQAAAPYLMPVEVTNALHRRVLRGELSVEDAIRLLEHLLASGIELRDEPDLHVRALQLASQHRQWAIYDATISHRPTSWAANSGPLMRDFTVQRRSSAKAYAG